MEKVEAKSRVVQVPLNSPSPKQAAAMFSDYIKAITEIKAPKK